ncbi:MAG: DUF1175 family protein [Vicinamibacterales bacterium]|nr:DUF1175 family protein [Vicinamibacterales bacterium]
MTTHSRRCPPALRVLGGVLLCALSFTASPLAQVRLADQTDREAFRAWFTFLADVQFERAAPEVIDCAALVRFAFREALRAHTPEWARRVGLPVTPRYPDVRSAPQATAGGWPLFRIAAPPAVAYAEFADARTLIQLNARRLGRDAAALRPGDLLYFHQPQQQQPDHLMVFVGPSTFDRDAADWVVYHTGPGDGDPGEVRKVRLADLAAHPAPRWRPHATNPQFVGVFRLDALR